MLDAFAALHKSGGEARCDSLGCDCKQQQFASSLRWHVDMLVRLCCARNGPAQRDMPTGTVG